MALFQPAAPVLVLAAAITILLSAIAIHRDYRAAMGIAAAGLMAALAVIPCAIDGTKSPAAALFAFTPQSLGFCALIIISALAVLVLAAVYFQPLRGTLREEYPLLLLLATFGAVVMAVSTSLISLFLGVETMGLAMTGMVAYPGFRPQAEEAGFKYLVLSGMSSAAGLFGMGFIALATGSLSLAASPAADPGMHTIILAGLALLGIAAGFKLSVVPFHFWVPDVYAGSPAPSAAYLAVIPKIALLAVLMRVLGEPGMDLTSGLALAITITAGLSMLMGNLLALMQENIKRILGYSSIAHLGNILFAVLAAGTIGNAAALFYIATYSLTVIAAFGVLGVLSRAADRHDLDELDDLRGLFWSHPVLAGMMTLTMLSLAGVPPAVGFTAKMYIMAAGINANLMLLVWTMVVSSVLGLFYYLRVIIVMSLRPKSLAAAGGAVFAIPFCGQAVVALFGALIAGFGLDPELLTTLLKSWLG